MNGCVASCTTSKYAVPSRYTSRVRVPSRSTTEACLQHPARRDFHRRVGSQPAVPLLSLSGALLRAAGSADACAPEPSQLLPLSPRSRTRLTPPSQRPGANHRAAAYRTRHLELARVGEGVPPQTLVFAPTAPCRMERRLLPAAWRALPKRAATRQRHCAHPPPVPSHKERSTRQGIARVPVTLTPTPPRDGVPRACTHR